MRKLKKITKDEIEIYGSYRRDKKKKRRPGASYLTQNINPDHRQYLSIKRRELNLRYSV